MIGLLSELKKSYEKQALFSQRKTKTIFTSVKIGDSEQFLY